VYPDSRQAGAFEHGGHQRNDGDVFRKMRVGTDRAAEVRVPTVAEAGLIASTQMHHLEAERGIEQGENGGICGR
jgi:hypothetical protein